MNAALPGAFSPARLLPHCHAASLSHSLQGAKLQVCATSLPPESCVLLPWGARAVCLSTAKLGRKAFSLWECINPSQD